MIIRIFQVLEDLVSKGLTKAIGVSNFSITKLENLLKTATIVPAVNQGIVNKLISKVIHDAKYS